MGLPIKGGKITTAYKKPGKMWSKGYHTGVDFACPVGTDVIATSNQKVVAANWGASYGTQIIVELADGNFWIYGHLSKSLVNVGDKLKKGQHIGESGNTGNSSGPHLHCEKRSKIRWSDGHDLDPTGELEA